jgi:integrase
MGLRRVAEPAGITRSIVQMFVSAGKGDGDECRSRPAVRPRAASLPHSLGRWMGCGLAALSQIALALVYDARRRPAADDRERLPRSLPAGLRNLLPTDFDREADKVKALSELELAALLRALPEASRPFLAFLAETGLRIGEAIELRWRDVDLGGRWLSIERRFYRGEVGLPKGRKTRRVRLSERLARDLWALRKATKAGEGEDELVWTSSAASASTSRTSCPAS